ncbi:MAG: HEAT repeat domain-containing protein, partial [Candidatus Marinimicrobia bacterium]|nr:HEAT repeat domain-containing protein [Candidatus Neomarinimicrobiota bacterium]
MKSSPNENSMRHSRITIKLALIGIIITIIGIIIGLFLAKPELWKYITSWFMNHPIFLGVMISWLVAFSSTGIVFLFARFNRDKKQYEKILNDYGIRLTAISIFVIFYISINLASEALTGSGVPIFSEPYKIVIPNVTPQDAFLILLVIIIIFLVFIIAPRYGHGVTQKTFIIMSLAMILGLLFLFSFSGYAKPISETFISWDNVPGDDNEKLLNFLKDEFDIDWAENAEISKSNDGTTINISKDENSVEIMMGAKKEKATLKISDGRTHDLKVKKENGKLNIYSLGISKKEKKYAKIVAKGTECNPRKVKLFLNTLRIRQAIVDKSGGELNPAIAAKLFVIEYTFEDFYKDVKLYRVQDFLWTVERLARGEVYLFSWDNVPGNDSKKLRRSLKDDFDIVWAESAEIQKSGDGKTIHISKDEKSAEIEFDGVGEQATLGISGGETYDLKVKKENDIYWEVDKELREDSKKSGTLLNKYCENEALMSLLKDEPFFGRINIDAYVHLSGIKPPEPEEVLGFDKSKLEVLLSGDSVKTDHTASTVRKMPNSDMKHYVDAIIPKLTDDNKDDVRANAAVALGNIGDANAVGPLIKALEDKAGAVNVRVGAAGALGAIGDAKAVEPLITALNDKDIAVRNKAEKALVKIGDEAVGSLIGKLDEVLQKQGYSRMRECAA